MEDFMEENEEINYPPWGLPPLDKKSVREVPFPEMTDKHMDDVKWLGQYTSVVKKCKPKDKQPNKPWCIYKHDVKKQPKGFPKHYPTKEDAEEGLRLMQIYKHKSSNNFYYHVTPAENVESILEKGLLPKSPEDIKDKKAVYLFPDKATAEEALMNWLGDRFEDEDLALLKIDKSVLQEQEIKIIPGEVGYEVMSLQPIPREAISVEEML
jgi:hypothetical protein